MENNALLYTLNEFFEQNTFNRKVQEYEFDPTPELIKLQIDYFPGRKGGFNQYARMGPILHNQNVLVIKDIETSRGKNLVERAAVALLSSSDPIDAIVLESVENPAWKGKMLDGKEGRKRWLNDPNGSVDSYTNVYLTREQVQKEFLGGKKQTRTRRRRTKRNKRFNISNSKHRKYSLF